MQQLNYSVSSLSFEHTHLLQRGSDQIGALRRRPSQEENPWSHGDPLIDSEALPLLPPAPPARTSLSNVSSLMFSLFDYPTPPPPLIFPPHPSSFPLLGKLLLSHACPHAALHIALTSASLWYMQNMCCAGTTLQPGHYFHTATDSGNPVL